MRTEPLRATKDWPASRNLSSSAADGLRRIHRFDSESTSSREPLHGTIRSRTGGTPVRRIEIPADPVDWTSTAFPVALAMRLRTSCTRSFTGFSRFHSIVKYLMPCETIVKDAESLSGSSVAPASRGGLRYRSPGGQPGFHPSSSPMPPPTSTLAEPSVTAMTVRPS